MYKRVSGVKFWLLGYITWGIYPLIIWGRMTQNMNKMARQVGEPGIPSYATSVLLGFVTFGIYSIIWIFRFFGLATRLSERASAGITPSSTFVKFLMSCIPIYSFFWLAGVNNDLIAAYKKLHVR